MHRYHYRWLKASVVFSIIAMYQEKDFKGEMFRWIEASTVHNNSLAHTYPSKCTKVLPNHYQPFKPLMQWSDSQIKE